MDQVKDILRKIGPHRFWILLLVALLLPVWGWWSTTNELIAKTKARVTAIQQSINAIPKPTESNPNEIWTEGVRKVNEVQDAELKKAWASRYEKQKKLYIWPEGVGFTNPDEVTDVGRARYHRRYLPLVGAVYQEVNTVDGQYLNPGPVIFPEAAMPRAAWANNPRISPDKEQIKAAQEDLWLLSSLLRSIRATNGSAKTPLKAAVVEIRKIQLRGGSLGGAAAGGGGGAPGPAPEGGGMMMRGRMRDEEGGPSPAAATTAAGPVDAKFDPSEEMGADPEANKGANRGGADGDGPRFMRGGGEGGPPPEAAPSGPPKGRYLDELPQARKRGFYLEVVIDQSKLPELLVNLSGGNGEWPVRILHVNLAELRADPLNPPADEGVGVVDRHNRLKGEAGNPGLPPGVLAPGLRPQVPVNMPPGAQPGVTEEASMANPYLAVAAISGYIVLYNPPPQPEAQAGQTPEGQSAPAGQVAPVPAGQNPAVAPAPAGAGNPAAPGKATGTTNPAPPAAGGLGATAPKSPPDSKGTSPAVDASKTGGGLKPAVPAKPADTKPAEAKPGLGTSTSPAPKK